MSSFNIDDVSGDEVRNLSMQWNYVASPQASNRRSTSRQRREPVQIPRMVKTFFNAICMIAGAATTVVAISFATGWIRVEDIQRIIQS